MAYLLLGLETLATALLFTATLAALGGRLRGRWRRRLLFAVAILGPLAVLCGLAVLAGLLQFAWDASDVWFVPALLLTVAFAGSALAVLGRGARVTASAASPEAEARPSSGGWPAGRLAAALLVAALLTSLTFWNMDLTVKQELSFLRAQVGEKWIYEAPKRLPPRENAAWIYLRAFKAMASPDAPVPAEIEDLKAAAEERIGDPKGWKPRWAEWAGAEKADLAAGDAELREYLRLQAPAVALLCEAAAKPDCEFSEGSDWYLNSPRTHSVMPAGRLLALDAEVKAADGNLRAAMESAGALFGMARHLGSGPSLLNWVVGATLEGLASSTLSRLLPRREIPPELLDAIRIDPDFSFSRQLRRAIYLEENIVLWGFCLMGGGRSDVEKQFAIPLLDHVMPLYRVFLLREDLAAFRRYMSEFQASIAEPLYKDYEQKSQSLQTLMEPRWGLLSRIVAASYRGLPGKAANTDAKRRLAIALLAIHRHRSATGQLVERLDELVPRYLSAVPIDPFSGKSLLVRRTESEILVYSVGRNGKDDGGVSGDSKTPDADDIVLRVASLTPAK